MFWQSDSLAQHLEDLSSPCSDVFTNEILIIIKREGYTNASTKLAQS